MEDFTQKTDDELKEAQVLGAATYAKAYIHLMSRRIGVPVEDEEDVNEMVVTMVPALNHATEAMWRALMHDLSGMHEAITKFKFDLERIS